MLGKIDVINYERCYPKRLKKYFQSKMNYKTYADFVPYTEHATVGNIPKEIIRLFEQNERGTKIKLFSQPWQKPHKPAVKKIILTKHVRF